VALVPRIYNCLQVFTGVRSWSFNSPQFLSPAAHFPCFHNYLSLLHQGGQLTSSEFESAQNWNEDSHCMLYNKNNLIVNHLHDMFLSSTVFLLPGTCLHIVTLLPPEVFLPLAAPW
jgi:hypothetical protein